MDVPSLCRGPTLIDSLALIAALTFVSMCVDLATLPNVALQQQERQL